MFYEDISELPGVRRGHLGGEDEDLGDIGRGVSEPVGGRKSCWMGKGCLALLFSGRWSQSHRKGGDKTEAMALLKKELSI